MAKVMPVPPSSALLVKTMAFPSPTTLADTTIVAAVVMFTGPSGAPPSPALMEMPCTADAICTAFVSPAFSPSLGSRRGTNRFPVLLSASFACCSWNSRCAGSSAASAYHVSRSIVRRSAASLRYSSSAFFEPGSSWTTPANPNMVPRMSSSGTVMRSEMFHQRCAHALRAFSMAVRAAGSVVREISCSNTCDGESGSMPLRGQIRCNAFTRSFHAWSAGSAWSRRSRALRCVPLSWASNSRMERALTSLRSPPARSIRGLPSSSWITVNPRFCCCAAGTASTSFGINASSCSR